MSDGPMSLGEKIERFIETVDRVPQPTTAKVRRICYTGEDVEPDPMENLAGEREAAVWILGNRKVEAPVKAALVRYIEAIDRLMKADPCRLTSYDGFQMEHEDGWIYEYTAGQVPRRVRRVSTSATPADGGNKDP